MKCRTIPSRSFDSLVVNACNAIAKQDSINFETKKLRSCSSILNKRDEIDLFVSTTMQEINADTFRPLKYTDTKGSRKFSIVACIFNAGNTYTTRPSHFSIYSPPSRPLH